MKYSAYFFQAFRRWRKACFFLAAWLVCQAAAGEGFVSRVGERRYLVELGYDIRSRAAAPDRMTVALPLPLAEHYQDVFWREEPEGAVARYPETGDEYLSVRFRRWRLGGEREWYAGYRFEVAVGGLEADFSRMGETYPYRQSEAAYRKYTGYNGEYIAPKHGRITRAARELGSGTPLEFARKAYVYVVRNFRVLETSGARPLEEVFERGGGSKVDVCSVLVSLLRHKGIPARHVAGFGMGGEERVYVEFFLEHYGWLPVDVVTAAARPGADGFGRIRAEDAVIVMSRDIDLTVRLLSGEQKVTLMTKGLLRWSRRHAPGHMKVGERFYFVAEPLG